MPNSFSLSFSPIKRRTLSISQSPPAAVELAYRERLLHSGIISSFVSGTQFKSLANPIPDDAPINSSLKVELPATSQPHVNPKGLKYSVRIISSEGDISWRDLVSLEDSGTGSIKDSLITIDASIDTALVGARWDILYPVDDGIRYVSTVSAVDSQAKTVTGQADNIISELSLVDGKPDFDLVVVSATDGSIQTRTISSLTDFGTIVITLDSWYTNDPSVNDIIFIKSAKWTGFSNPIYDPYTDLAAFKTFLTTAAPTLPIPLIDPLFDTDVVIGDGNATAYPVFDYESEYSTGEIVWFGNSITGLKSQTSPKIYPVDYTAAGADPALYTTNKPLAPYNMKLKWSGTALGTTNFITEGQAFTLVNGDQDANTLHHHDSYIKQETYTQQEVLDLINSSLHWIKIGDDVYQRYEGKVGIGKATNPKAHLHIKTNEGDQFMLERSSVDPDDVFDTRVSAKNGYFSQASGCAAITSPGEVNLAFSATLSQTISVLWVEGNQTHTTVSGSSVTITGLAVSTEHNFICTSSLTGFSVQVAVTLSNNTSSFSIVSGSFNYSASGSNSAFLPTGGFLIDGTDAATLQLTMGIVGSGGIIRTNVPNSSFQFDNDLTVFGNFQTPSDERIKTNIENISNPLEFINKMQGVYFDFEDSQREFVNLSGHRMGYIAQQMQEIFPFVVKETGKNSILSIRYQDIIPVLSEGIKELCGKIEELQDKVEELEEKVNNES